MRSPRANAGGTAGEVGNTINHRIEPWGDQGGLAGPETRPAEAIPLLSEHQGLWPRRQGLPGEPCWASLRVIPDHEWVIEADRFQPAGPRDAFDRLRPPDTRHHQGPTRRDIDTLSRPHAPHRRHAGLHEQGEMGRGTQAAIGHEHVPWGYARMHPLHLGEIVGEEGCDDELEEQARARLAQPQPSRPGEAAPRALLRRLTAPFLQGWGIGHRAARAIDQQWTRALPSPFVQDGSLHGAAEAL